MIKTARRYQRRTAFHGNYTGLEGRYDSLQPRELYHKPPAPVQVYFYTHFYPKGGLSHGNS